MQRILHILFLFFFYPCYTQTVDPIFRHITRSSGLPVEEVSCLAQDSSGYMWLGTKEGLYRYDGFTFKGFYNEPGNTHTIPGNYILHIYVDRKGLLWIVTAGNGLALIDNEGRVLQVLNSSADASLACFDYTNVIKEDKKGSLWCTTNKGLFRIRHSGDTISVAKHIDFSSLYHASNDLGRFVLDNLGNLWICTGKGLAVYDPARNILYNSKNNPQHMPFLNDTAFSADIFLDEQKARIWYATWMPSIRMYDKKNKGITTIYAPEKDARPDFNQLAHCFFGDSRHNLWMATGMGLRLFTGKTLHRFMHQNGEDEGIVSNNINDICEDREGNFWFATTKGISTAQPYSQAFLNLSANSKSKYGFGNEAVVFVVPVNGNTLLIGSNGVYETDMHFNVKKHFYFGSIDYDWTWAYYKDEAHRLVYISTQNGMLLYDIKGHTMHKLTAPPFNDHRGISSFVSDGDGSIWMSHYRNDFIKYNLTSKKFKRYTLTDLKEESSILHLYKDKGQQLWIVLDGKGLLRFDEKSEKITERIVTKAGIREGLLQGNIVALKDLGNEIFIGYQTKGFSLYNKASKTFRHFSRSDGLVSNIIAAVESTYDGNLWIATPNGLSRFDSGSKKITNFNYDNGILENNFQSITQLPDGRIVAGGSRGLVLFHPDSVYTCRNVPPPVITSITQYGSRIPADSLLSKHLPLRISYKENYFAVEYISLLFFKNNLVEYAYKMEGLDKNWIIAGNRRFVSYAQLKGGSYTFRVKARLPGSDWVESSSALSFIVSEAFYTQGWFYDILALVLLTVMYGFYRYRVQQIIRLERMRTAISSDLHDEVGATLSSISIFSEIARSHLDNSSIAGPYLQRIGERSRESIEKMSDIIWSINPENDGFDQMLIRMKNYANELLEAKNMTIHWQESELSGLKLSMAQRKNLYLLFKEIINNAAKYSRAGNLHVCLLYAHNNLQLTVKDDGIGFNIPGTTLGNGIRNIQRRSASLHGKIEIQSGSNGTFIRLLFQL